MVPFLTEVQNVMTKPAVSCPSQYTETNVSHYGALQRQNALTTFFDSLLSDMNELYFRSLTYAQRDNAVKTRIAV